MDKPLNAPEVYIVMMGDDIYGATTDGFAAAEWVRKGDEAGYNTCRVLQRTLGVLDEL